MTNQSTTRKTPSAGDDETSSPPQRKSGLNAAEAARLAAEQVAGLTGREPQGIVGVEGVDDGWRVDIEVVESARIPSSADMLAIYTAELSTDGALISCRRTSRYQRGSGYSGEGQRS